VRRLIVDVLCQILERPRTDAERIQTLDGDIVLESVAFVELQVWLEDELDIEIDPVHVVELNIVDDIAEYILSLIQAK